jgi:hypothetical protein
MVTQGKSKMSHYTKYSVRLSIHIWPAMIGILGLLALPSIVHAALIKEIVRANGQSGNRPPIGKFNGNTSPLVTDIYGLMDNKEVFSDRTYTWIYTPAELVGSEYVRTFNADKTTLETDVTYTMTLSRRATVWLTIDDRIPATTQQEAVDLVVADFATPGMFTDSGLNLYINEGSTMFRPMSVFWAVLRAGKYTFGAHPTELNFYTVGAMALPPVADFEDLALAPESFWNGSDGSGGFTSGQARLGNVFTDWGGGITSWEGFAYSNRTDTALVGSAGQYTAAGGTAHSGRNYAVGYIGFSSLPTITLSSPMAVPGLYVSNSLYSASVLRDGDSTFGVEPFSDGDWFSLTITGKDSAGQALGSQTTYLADFRDGRRSILTDWRFVDLSALGVVSSLEFSLASSDVSSWGMNTPAYFVVDTIVSEFILTGPKILKGTSNNFTFGSA